MGLLDMLSNVVDAIPKEHSSDELPSYTCHNRCELFGKDFCKNTCRNDTKKMEQLLEEIEALEDQLDAPPEQITYSPSDIPTKCQLCGAPIDSELTSCPYCDTDYPKSVSGSKKPNSKREITSLIQEKSVEILSIYKNRFSYYSSSGNTAQNTDPNKKEGVLGKLAFTFMSYSVNTFDKQLSMSGADVMECAKHYSVPVSEYLLGLFKGKYQTLTGINNEKQNEIYAQRSLERQQQRAQFQQQNQAMHQQAIQEINERAAQNRNYYHEQEMIRRSSLMNSVPNYSGGGGSSTGSCCGNCTYYMKGPNKCAYSEFRHPSGASDYCQDHRSM